MESYKEFINNILETRGRHGCGNEYHETHHIQPKCCQGTDDKGNMIDLFAREHFEAHRLLALENPDNEKLVYAWWCMSIMTNEYTKERYHITAEEYEEIHIKYSKLLSDRMSGENHPMYGCHWSLEQKEKISNKLKEFYKNPENHPRYGKHMSEESKAKISAGNKCRHPSQADRDKMSQKNKGLNNPASKQVAQYDKNGNFICHWDYATLASKTLNIDLSSIIKCCRGKKKTAGGYIWKYDAWDGSLPQVVTDSNSNQYIGVDINN